VKILQKVIGGYFFYSHCNHNHLQYEPKGLRTASSRIHYSRSGRAVFVKLDTR